MTFSQKIVYLVRQESGSSLVLTALMMLILLAAAGLVIDGGKLYVTKSHLQKTANAAVLSGAQELTNNEQAVKQVIAAILAEHDEESSLTDSVIVLNDKVTVRLQRDVPLSFSSLFGFDDAPVSVVATAQLRVMGRATGVAPLGIDESVPLEFYKEYKLKVDQTESDTGYFGILALGGNGARTYEDNLKYGYQSEIELGDIIDTETGNIAGKTREGVSSRINRCPYPEGEYHHRDCERVILIPVYKKHNYGGNQLKQIKVVGFAYFYISKPMSDQDKTITGMFIKRAGTGFAEPGAPDKGAYTIRLVDED